MLRPQFNLIQLKNFIELSFWLMASKKKINKIFFTKYKLTIMRPEKCSLIKIQILTNIFFKNISLKFFQNLRFVYTFQSIKDIYRYYRPFKCLIVIEILFDD